MSDYDEYLIDDFNKNYAPYFYSKDFYDLIEFFVGGGLSIDAIQAAALFYLETYLVANSTAVASQWSGISAQGDTFAAAQVTLWTGWGVSFVGTTI